MVRIVAGEMELVGERGDKKAKGGSKKKTKKKQVSRQGVRVEKREKKE